MGAFQQITAPLDELLTKYKDHPDYVKVINDTAFTFRKNKQYDKAVELYQQALSSNPDAERKLDAQAGMAKAYVHMDKSAEVDAIVRQIMTDYPEAEKPGYHNFQIGEEYYFRAEEVGRNNDQEQIRLNFQRALDVWQKNIQEVPDVQHQCYACFYTGMIFEKRKEYEKAIEYYDRVVNDFPDSGKVCAAHSLTAGIYYTQYQSKIISKAQAADEIQQINQIILSRWPDSPSLSLMTLYLRDLQ